MRLAVDIDGCIADFVSGFQFHLETWNNQCICDLNRYDLGLNEWDYRTAYDAFVADGGLLALSPYEGVVYTLQQWAKTHQLTYLTRRRPGDRDEKRMYQISAQTLLWLRRHDFPQWANVAYTQNKTSHCHANDIPVLIEDYLPDLKKFQGFTRSGLPLVGVLLDRPWNQGEHPRRVKHLHEAEGHFPTVR